MKKNYFMVLIALLAMALNVNAQEGTNDHMTIKMNDGTSYTLDINEVAEISFGEGESSLSAQNIIKALSALDELGQYVYKFNELEARDNTLETAVTVLNEDVNETKILTYENRARTDVLNVLIQDQVDRSSALESRMNSNEQLVGKNSSDIEWLKLFSDQQTNKITLQQDKIDEMRVKIDILEEKIEQLTEVIRSMQQ